MAPKLFLNIPIFSSRCEYDSSDFFPKKNDWNLPVERVKVNIVGSGWNSSEGVAGVVLTWCGRGAVHFR